MALKKIYQPRLDLNIISSALWDLPTPSSIRYFWNFGSTLGLCLVIQLIRGFILTTHYIASSSEAFDRLILIIQETWIGWIIRFTHINGASIFFIFIYLHLFRGIWFNRSKHIYVWLRGVTILIILIAISFLGYVLPWGQISYWAVVVIINLLTVIPYLGESLTTWVWGGYRVGAPTLTRFFSLHFIIPFILAILVMVHLIFLHKEGSSSNLGLNRNSDKIPFHPYYTSKDLYFFLVVLNIFIALNFFYPFILIDRTNRIKANPMVTPAHIQPEWYFLVSYAILRSFPSKIVGVVALILSVTIFLAFPLFKYQFAVNFNLIRKLLFWSTIRIFIFLIKIGSIPAEHPWSGITILAGILYFLGLLCLNF